MANRAWKWVPFAILLAAGASVPAVAQEAAESAVLNAGTAQGAGAERSLGNAIGRSLRSAGNFIGSLGGTQQGRASAPTRSASYHSSYTIPGGIDPLAGTDAPTYRLATGSVMRVTSGLQPSATTICIANCPGAASNWR